MVHLSSHIHLALPCKMALPFKDRDMSIIPKIAFRNLLRQKRRSFLTALSMIIGFILLSLSFAFGEGGYGYIIEMFTHSHTGHIQIHKKGYLERPNIYKSFGYGEPLQKILRTIPKIKAEAPRIYCGAIAFIDQKSSGAGIIGVDPLKESRLSTLVEKVGQGKFLEPSSIEEPHNQIIIGNGLARILRATVGSEVAMVSQGADGSIANDLFTVVGILKKEVDSTDRNNCYIHIYKAREFMAMDDKVHEVALILPSHKDSREITELIQKKLAAAQLDGYEVHPWEMVEELFHRSMEADKKGNWVFLFIIGLIVALGVLNTVLMSILERTREFGVMRAMGTRPSQIFFQIVMETLFLSLLATFTGAICSIPVILPFAVYGLPIVESMTIGGIEITSFRAGFVPEAFWIPFTVIVSTTTLVSLIPAIYAARIKPVDAMRSY